MSEMHEVHFEESLRANPRSLAQGPLEERRGRSA